MLTHLAHKTHNLQVFEMSKFHLKDDFFLSSLLVLKYICTEGNQNQPNDSE